MSQDKRLQNVVTTSSFLLPVAAVYCALIWVLGNPTYEISHWIGLLFCAVCTILMMELNNSYLLIRVRTRMVATTFMILWSCCGFLHPFQFAHISVLCLLFCYHALFRIYQVQQSTGDTFLIYGCLGLTCLFIQPLCALALVFFIVLSYFRTLTFKSFLAGIIGFILPFWLAFSFCFLTDRLVIVQQFMEKIRQCKPFQYHEIPLSYLLALGLLLILVIPSIIHFLRNAFQDKIRVRMFYYFMMWIELALLCYIILFPHLFKEFYLMLIMNSSPLIAHFFTLTHHKISNIFFQIAGILILLFTIYNLWMPSYNFF